MADENLINQDEIEALLNQASPGPPAKVPASAGPPADAPLLQESVPPLMEAPDLVQDDIEALLRENAVGTAAPARSAAKRGAASGEPFAPGDMEYLLNQASEAIESVSSGLQSQPVPGTRTFSFEDFAGAPPSTESTTIDLIRDVELDLKIELGRTNMYLDDVLRLHKGSVVPLDKMAGDPVDIYVNGRLIARGEVLVLNDNFCVRVAELIAGVTPGL